MKVNHELKNLEMPSSCSLQSLTSRNTSARKEWFARTNAQQQQQQLQQQQQQQPQQQQQELDILLCGQNLGGLSC